MARGRHRGTGRWRSPIAAAWTAAATLAGALVAAGAAGEPLQTLIECDLTGPKGRHYAYSFAFDHAKATVLWVDGSRELKIERHTPSELLVSYRGKFSDPAADAALFDLNLFSGAATVSYVHDPTPAEVEQCERERGWGCKDPVVLPEYDESGSCTLTEHGRR